MLNKMYTYNNETENRVMNTMAELDAAYAAQTQAMKLEATRKWEDYRLRLQPVLSERSMQMALFRKNIAELQAQVAELQRTIADVEFSMADYKATSLIRSNQLDEEYQRYSTEMCERKLKLKQWFEAERERLTKENRQK